MPLAEVIRQRIRDEGPLPFATYAKLALYHPEFGYYARADQRSGRAGDFFTSVDLGPLFGEMLAVQCAEMWRHLGTEHFDLVEAGAGSTITVPLGGSIDRERFTPIEAEVKPVIAPTGMNPGSFILNFFPTGNFMNNTHPNMNAPRARTRIGVSRVTSNKLPMIAKGSDPTAKYLNTLQSRF